jgi:hypothetical protein
LRSSFQRESRENSVVSKKWRTQRSVSVHT